MGSPYRFIPLLIRSEVLELLGAYRPFPGKETADLAATMLFVAEHEDFAQRSHLAGHVTCSAWVLSPSGQEALLIHHRKIDKWLQPGGHVEEADQNILMAARREVAEETGLTALQPLLDGLFDVDVHMIPATAHQPAHLHYDLRVLFRLSVWEPLRIDPHESKAIRWTTLHDIADDPSLEMSLRRMAQKTLNA